MAEFKSSATMLPSARIFSLALIIGITALLFPQHQLKAQEQLLSDPGVVSYTFRTQLQEDFPGTLDIIREMGFTNMEFSSLFGETPDAVRAMLDERGMICTSYGTGYDALLNDIDQAADVAHTLGATHVRVAWITHQPPFTIDDARRTAEDFNTIGEALAERGLTFSYHNHGYEFRPYGDGTLFDYIVENTNPEFVHFEMDLFWVAHPGHDPVALLEKYPDRFSLVHLKDISVDAEHNFSGSAPVEYDVPLGSGQIDFQSFLEASQASGIEYFYIEDESPHVLTSVPQSLEYIRSLTN